MKRTSRTELLAAIPQLAWQANDYEAFWQAAINALSRSTCRRMLPPVVAQKIRAAWRERESLLG